MPTPTPTLPVAMPLDENIMRSMLDALMEGVYVLDTRRVIQYWNRGAEIITGYSAKEVIGVACSNNLLMHVDKAGVNLCKAGCPVSKSIADGKTHIAEVYALHKLGHRIPVRVRTVPLRDRSGSITGVIETFIDMTQRISAFEALSEAEEVRKLCPLTGLGNGSFAQEKLAEHVALANSGSSACGALLLEVDHFEALAAKLPEKVLQVFLKMVAQTVRHDLGGSDFAGRWGYDNFLVLLPGADAERLRISGKRLCALVAQSARTISRGRLNATVSIGGAMLSPEDTPLTVVDRLELLKRSSQRAGGNCLSM